MTTQTQTKPAPTTDDDRRAHDSAGATFRSIRAEVEALMAAREADDDEARDDAEGVITQGALSVEVRGDWHLPGQPTGGKPTEYRILLGWGGPAVRLIGELNDHEEPETATLEYQDWGTPWTAYDPDADDKNNIEPPEGMDDPRSEDILLEYARCFYFGG